MTLDDGETFFFTCPNCGEEFQEQWGRLKLNSATHCPECNHRMHYDPREFANLTREDRSKMGGKFSVGD